MINLLELLRYIRSLLDSTQLPSLGLWGYAVLAVLVSIEGPIATLLGAAAASTGILQPVPVFFVASLGNMSADMIWYMLGRLGKPSWLVAVCRWLKINLHTLETLQNAMHQHAARILFIAKLSAGLMIPSLIAAGLARVPIKRWLPALLLGEGIWTGSLVLIGYYATKALHHIEKGLHYFILATTTVCILLLLGSLHRLLQKRPFIS